jgi:ABC-type phosphate transport system substrate-binding protein
MRRLALILSLLLAAPPVAWGGAVVANDNVTLSSEEIRDVFLGERQWAGNVRLIPVDNSALQADFLSKMLQTDSQKYYARWTRKSFRDGLSAPSVKGSDAEVIAFIKSTPGAIGYVKDPVAGLKVLQSF